MNSRYMWHGSCWWMLPEKHGTLTIAWGKRSWRFSTRVGWWQKQWPPASENCIHQWYIFPAKLPPITHDFWRFQMVLPYSFFGSVALGVPVPAAQGKRRKVSHQIIKGGCVWFLKIWTQPWTYCFMGTYCIIKCCRAAALLLQNPAMCLH